MRWVARLGVGALVGAVVAAVGSFSCGPSFQAVYDGNVRFEHCYALEENPQTAMPEKAACWQDWSKNYTFGQTRDRVHYATSRHVALSRMSSAPTDEALMMAAPGETSRDVHITTPSPTNAFVPPPKTLDPDEHHATGTSHPGLGPPVVSGAMDAGAISPAPAETVTLPASGCSERCAATYRGCGVGCDADAGGGAPKTKECKTCQDKFRICMRACFK